MNKLSIFALVAAMSAGMNTMPLGRISRAVSYRPKHYPRMVTSTREEIAAHNRVVTTRQVLRRAARPWKLSKRLSAA